MVSYSILGPDGWERYEDGGEWRERSKELRQDRDKSRLEPTPHLDALEW